MPYRVKKLDGPRPYRVQKKKNGKWATIGSSKTLENAKRSIAIRKAGAKKKWGS